MFFSYQNLSFQYDPFPIGVARPLMDPDTYAEFVDSYPPVELFADLSKVGYKYSLSEKFNRRQYHQLVRSNPLWRELHGWIKSEDFVAGVMQALAERYIDLGYRRPPSAMGRLLKIARNTVRGRLCASPARLQARFEFSMLPADGGHVLPHTDLPSKVVTLIVSMVREGEWDPAFGGGTDVNRPKDMRHIFNRLNRQGRFEDMEVLNTFEFAPNQAVVFVKTFNSWHSVRPMRSQGSSLMRRTLTINIETS